MNANNSSGETHDSAGHAADDVAAFLLLRIGRDRYALPAACVREIVALGNVTPLPYAPAWVMGLANVGGSILPLLDPAQLLGNAGGEGNDVVLVRTPQSPCALRVGEVIARIAVERTGMRHVETGDGLVVAEFEHDGQPVLVLNPDVLGGLLATGEMPAGDAGLLGDAEIRAGDDDAGARSRAFLVFLVGGARYAMPLADVGEVITAPACTPLPGAPADVAGIGMLRDSPLLVVDAAGLLGVGTAGAGAALVIGDDDLRIGLLVDAVIAVERIDNDSLHPLPDDDGDIIAVAHQGTRITAILGIDGLLNTRRRQQWLPMAPSLKRREATVQRETQPFLEAAIADERFGIPLADVQRILRWSPPEMIDQAGGLAVGAIQVEGHVVPVLNPRLLQPRAQDSANGAWILVGNDGDTWAVAVSEARRIVQVPVDSIEAIGGDNRLLQGIANVDRQLLSLVSFRQLAAQVSP